MWKNIGASVVGGVIVMFGSFGLGVLLDAFGTQQILAETRPALTAFLPHIGIGAIFAAVVMAAVTVHPVLKRYDKHLVETTIKDLTSFMDARESKSKWEWFVKHATREDLMDDKSYPDYGSDMEYRYKALGKLYFKWLAGTDSEGNASLDGLSGSRAVRCIEYLRMHGYFKGRLRMYRDRTKYTQHW